ncbi:methylated-DNA--[protein]-cysteine S-methyltransferase [Carnobacteriaceae bacterium zg-ZUI78]|nr:methylated-DNA--[protein]-cysteine S-methyltransferase [Carnobacteriaceae bacterium zg-ZUI78]
MYYSTIFYHMHTYYIVVSEKGLVSIDISPFYVQLYQAIKCDEKTNIYVQQLMEYFTKKRTVFDVVFDLRGTPFQIEVWKALLSVPFGSTATYTDIACLINKPKSVRAVANAIGKNPILMMIPCHRILGKNGYLGGFRAGISLKIELLEHEKEKYTY